MQATLPWNTAEDQHGRWAAVAATLGGPAEAARVAPAFESLLRRVGIEPDYGRELVAERLAAQMARPENASMRRSNAREVMDQDLLAFARTLLGAA
jgi:hypothetical protein